MKKVLALFFVLFFLNSCSDDDDAAIPETPAILIKKIISTNTAGSVTVDFVYNGNKLKEYAVNGQSTKFTYVGDLITNVKSYNVSSVAVESTYTYDTNNRVIQQKDTYFSGTVENKTYTYNANNTIDFVISDESFTPTGNSGKIYINSVGETTKVENFYQGNLTNTSLISYDAKNSPLKNIMGFAKIPLNYAVHNNLLSFSTTNSSNIVTSNSDFVNTYDANDYLMTTVQQFYNNGVLQSTTTSQYLY